MKFISVTFNTLFYQSKKCVLNIYMAKNVNYFVNKMKVQLIMWCESREEAKTMYFRKFMAK